MDNQHYEREFLALSKKQSEKYWKAKRNKNMDNTFEELVRPLMKYLAENHHPYTSIYITSMQAELLEVMKGVSTEEHIVD